MKALFGKKATPKRTNEAATFDLIPQPLNDAKLEEMVNSSPVRLYQHAIQFDQVTLSGMLH
jgi:hypothetical protein